ncbi:MAG: ribonuclease HI family protein [Deltaproteobacteria bacterium]|nr:ribonuclease HI family protein [Deltaproteobacteria bacterium]
MPKKDIKSEIIHILRLHKIGEETAKIISDEIINLIKTEKTISVRYAEVYIDGGSRGNPGEGASAFIIYSGEKKYAEGGKYFYETTNNEAEYNALILALRECLKYKISDVSIYTDSELLERQIKKIYSVKSPSLSLLYKKASLLIAKFQNFSITHIPREKNSEADRLANLIMDTKTDYLKKYNEK